MEINTGLNPIFYLRLILLLEKALKIHFLMIDQISLRIGHMYLWGSKKQTCKEYTQ